MAKTPKVRFNVATSEGATGADKEQKRLYQFVMGQTAAWRYNYLTNSGWKQLGKENVPSRTDPEKTFVRVSWQAPERFKEKKPFNQTKALLYQIWIDLEENGVVYRGDKLPAVGAALASAVPIQGEETGGVDTAILVKDNMPPVQTTRFPPVNTTVEAGL